MKFHDFLNAVASAKMCKRPGSDGVVVEMVRALSWSTLLWLYLLFLIRLGGWETERPDAWREVVLTAIPKKSDKVGFRSMRYISLLPVIQKFKIRALQTAVRRERRPHETNILGNEPGRSTAGVTATLRQVFGKAAEWGVGAFVASADVEGAFDCIKHDDVEKTLLQKGVHPESVCSLLRESLDLKGRINVPGAPMSHAFLYARGARQGSVEGPDMWNQVLDNALREPAGRWESEGIGFMLAKDYRKSQKRRRGSSGDAVKDEGRVLHHFCWADDLYAMALNHLTRILEDMTNAVERLGMRWKEKSLTIVAGPFTEYKPGDVVEIISDSGKRWIWRVWRAWRHWTRGWTIEAARRPACGTGSPKPTPCSTRRRLCSVIPNCLSKGEFTPFTRRVCQLCSMVLVNGLTHSQCSSLCKFGNWESFVKSCACAGDLTSAGLIT